jgi:FAD/FMN-containing dehydrogenase
VRSQRGGRHRDSVGVAGLTVGGGYGMLIGVAGLAVDNLLSAGVVLADGQVVTTDAARQHRPLAPAGSILPG